MSLLLVLLSWLAAASAGKLTVTMLDVGQGDAFVLQTEGGKAVLIDAGDGDVPVVGLLYGMGISSLDLVIATHPHADHIGGMTAVLNHHKVRFYTDNGMPHTTATYEGLLEVVEEKRVTYRPAERGQSYNLDDETKIEVLFPSSRKLRDTRSDLNSNSVVVRVQHKDVCMLFTGDAEEPTERALYRDIGECQVLKVAHHGSGHSTSDAWLRAVEPRIALISAGKGNSYGHPDPETLGRLERAGTNVFRTDTQGHIRVVSDGTKVTASPITLSSGCTYAGSSRSDVFHDPGCENAAKIGAHNYVCYVSREAVDAADKRPAGCCKPR